MQRALGLIPTTTKPSIRSVESARCTMIACNGQPDGIQPIAMFFPGYGGGSRAKYASFSTMQSCSGAPPVIGG